MALTVNLRLEAIKDVAEALRAIAEALTKFGDAVAHWVKLGAQGYGAVAASVAERRLRDIHSSLVQVWATSAMLINDFDIFIEDFIRNLSEPRIENGRRKLTWRRGEIFSPNGSREYSSMEDYRTIDQLTDEQRFLREMESDDSKATRNLDEAWIAIKKRLSDTIEKSAQFAEGLKAERSDFAFEPAFASLVDTLGRRNSVLQRLQALEKPGTAEEIEALKILLGQYRRVKDEVRAASAALADYLKASAGS